MATIHLSPTGVIIDTGDEVIMRTTRGCQLNRVKLNELGYGSVYKENGYWVLYDVEFSYSDKVAEGEEPIVGLIDQRIKFLYIHYNPNKIDNFPPCAVVAMENYGHENTGN